MKNKLVKFSQLQISYSLVTILSTLFPITNSKAQYFPIPSKEELLNILRESNKCSSKNNKEDCDSATQLANNLLDHPGLSFRCKDAAWELIQAAKIQPKNTFKRRGLIDQQAKRIVLLCSRKADLQNKESLGVKKQNFSET